MLTISVSSELLPKYSVLFLMGKHNFMLDERINIVHRLLLEVATLIKRDPGKSLTNGKVLRRSKLKLLFKLIKKRFK